MIADILGTPAVFRAPVKRGRRNVGIPMECLDTPVRVQNEFIMSTPVAAKAIPKVQMRTVSFAPGVMEVVKLGTETMQDINVHTFLVAVHHDKKLPLKERRRYGFLIDGLGTALAFVQNIKRGGGSENGGGRQVSTIEVQLLANPDQADLPLTEAVYSFYVLVEFHPTGGSFPKLVTEALLSSINDTKKMFLDFVETNEKKYTTEMEKRPSAYLLFTGDEREDLVANGMSHKEAMVELGKMWGKLSATKKKTYETKAAALNAKYDKQKPAKYRTTPKYAKFMKAKEQHKVDKEKDEFYYNKKLALKRLEESRSRSKSAKPKAPKRSVSRSKSKARKAKKVKSRSRSRSKSKKRSAKKAAKKPEAPKPAAEPAAPAQ